MSEREQELNRWIAKKLEPNPKFSLHRTTGRDALSDCGFWWAEHQHAGYGRCYHAMDFCNDPALSMMLLEKLLVHHDITHIDRGGNPNYLFACFDGSKEVSTEADTLGLAIAEAFARAHGWEGQ